MDSAGFTPLHIAVQTDGDGVIKMVRMLLQAAPDAALMIDTHGRTPLRSAIFWFSTAAVLREILHIRPTCMSIIYGVWNGERGGRAASSITPWSFFLVFTTAETSTTSGIWPR